jgi:hypothetical protein
MEAIVENNLALMQKVADTASTCLKAKTSAEWKKLSTQIISFMSVVTENLARVDALEAERADENAKEVKVLEARIAKLKSLGDDPDIAPIIAVQEKKKAELEASVSAKCGFASAAAKNIDAYEAARVKVTQKKVDEQREQAAARLASAIEKRSEAAWPKVLENAKKAGIPDSKIQTVSCNKGKACKYGFECTFWHTDDELAHFLHSESD